MASVEVDFRKKTAKVTCEQGGCDTAALIAALEQAHYTGKVQ